MVKKKIGLIGEAPSDTSSMTNLLQSSYKEFADFSTLLNDIHGSMLEFQKVKHLLRKEYENQNPDIVLFIRDLDSIETDQDQIKKRKDYFATFNSIVDKRGIFLLNIFEIEALILADIETFNKEYGVSIRYESDPMHQKEPKEFLIQESKCSYNESDNPKLFAKLQFERLKTCRYFKAFLEKFDKMLAA